MILWSIPLGFACVLIWVWFELRIEDAQVEREADLFAAKQWITDERLREVMRPEPDWDKIRTLEAEEAELC